MRKTRVGIRDDDTSVLTDPDTLESVYQNIWEQVPVTIACIPFLSPEADVPEADTLEGERSIAENPELVSFLGERIRDDHVEIAQHGYDHTAPEGRPEFVAGENLAEKVQRGRRELAEAFDTDVDIFVPPHVRLSRQGLRAVTVAGMDIMRGRGPRPREALHRADYLRSYCRLLLFYLLYSREHRYPHPLDYGSHTELYCHRVNQYVDVETVKRSFEFIHERNGTFVVSVHANQLSSEGQRKLQSIVDFVLDYEVEGMTASDLIQTGLRDSPR